MTVRFVDRIAKPRRFKIGVLGDNNVLDVVFKLQDLDDEQVATLYWFNGNQAGSVTLTDGVWTVTDDVTQYSGEFECYVAIEVGATQAWHSELFWCTVEDIPILAGTDDILEG